MTIADRTGHPGTGTGRVRRYWLAGLGLLLVAALVQGGERIALSEEEITRLGVQFAPIQAIGSDQGIQLPATVIASPQSTSTVRALYPGVVQAWQAMPGEAVAEGQLLATITSREIVAIQEQWLAAASALKRARFELDKDRELFEEGIIAEQRLTETQTLYQQAAFAEQGARVLLTRAGFDSQQIEDIADKGDSAGLYFLRAPRAGVLARRLAVSGEVIQQDTLVAELGGGSLWVEADLPVKLAAMLETGQPVAMADSDVVLTVREIARAVDRASQTLTVRASLDGDSGYLPGQVVSLAVQPAGGGLMVPSSAVVHNGDDTVVYVRADDGIEARVLALTPAGAHYIARQGIAAGESVVVRGTAILKGIQLGLGGE